MQDSNELFRSLDTTEIEALGPMPVVEGESPTTDRDSRTPGLTAEVHSPGMLRQASDYVADDDPFPPPRSLTEED